MNDDGIIPGHQFEPYTEDTGGDDDETSDEEEADAAEVRQERMETTNIRSHYFFTYWRYFRK